MKGQQVDKVERSLRKEATGIQGFDEITYGGLPKGRPTLIVGGPGSGKTLFAMTFLINGALKYGEPGVFVSFEESEKELIENCRALGYDLKDLMDRKLLTLDYVKVEPDKIIETGEYDLEGLFIRISYAIDSIGAKRIALDTLETIFASFGHASIIRSEMSRLFRFMKDKGITAVVTAEAGERTLSRHGLEEYISDMVIALDHRVTDEAATRRLRVVKYRGSSHGTNEYPFLIESDGITVLPITSVGLTAKATRNRVPTGVPDLDKMLGGKGYFQGSTILVTGTAGSGKTSLAAEFARRACKDGRRVLYLVFEESASQITRNMRSIGVDLEPLEKSGRLIIHSQRPSSLGLEMHLAKIHKIVDTYDPDVVIFDPISALTMLGSGLDVKHMILRTADYLKMRGATVMFTQLRDEPETSSAPMISSLADTWIVLENAESSGEKNRLLRIVKSRGMAHSNQLREMNLTDGGIRITAPHISSAGVLTGTARYVQEQRDEAERIAGLKEVERLKLEMSAMRQKMQLQIKSMKLEMAEKEHALRNKLADEGALKTSITTTRKGISSRRASSGGRAK